MDFHLCCGNYFNCKDLLDSHANTKSSMSSRIDPPSSRSILTQIKFHEALSKCFFLPIHTKSVQLFASSGYLGVLFTSNGWMEQEKDQQGVGSVPQ